MNIKVDFDNIVVREDRNDFNVKVLMLKGEKGDKGDGEPNVIEKVQVNGTDLPVINKTVNVVVPPVDNAINSNSENPVQNKVIYNALSGKVDNSELNNYYEISEIDDFLNNKADVSELNKKPYVFNNVSDMKSYNLEVGNYVITKGYYEVEDGGNAEYVITNTQSNTEYQEALDNGLYANLIVKDYVTPEIFGAKADGTTDDSKAVQECIDCAILHGKYVYGSNKEYIVSNYRQAGSNYGIVITDSLVMKNIKLKLKDNSPDMTCVLLTNIDSDKYVKLENIEINGNRNNQETHVTPSQDGGRHGIRHFSQGTLYLDNVKIYDCYTDGLILRTGGSTFGNHIEIYNSGRNGVTDNSYYSEFNNINLHNNGKGISPQSGYHIEPDNESIMLKHIINNSVIKDNIGTNLKLHFNENGHLIDSIEIRNSEVGNIGIALIQPNENLSNYINKLLIENCNIINTLSVGPATGLTSCGLKELYIVNSVVNGGTSYQNKYVGNINYINSVIKDRIYLSSIQNIYAYNTKFERAEMPSSDNQDDVGILAIATGAGINILNIDNCVFKNHSRGIRTNSISNSFINNTIFNSYGTNISAGTITTKVNVTNNTASNEVGFSKFIAGTGNCISIGNDLRNITGSPVYGANLTITETSNLT